MVSAFVLSFHVVKEELIKERFAYTSLRETWDKANIYFLSTTSSQSKRQSNRTGRHCVQGSRCTLVYMYALLDWQPMSPLTLCSLYGVAFVKCYEMNFVLLGIETACMWYLILSLCTLYMYM